MTQTGGFEMSQPHPKMPKMPIPWWTFLLIGIVVVWFLYSGSSEIKQQNVVKKISTSDLYKAIENGTAKSILINPQTLEVSGEFNDGSKFYTTVSDVRDLEKYAIEKKVEVKTEPPSDFNWWNVIFYLFLAGLLLYFLSGSHKKTLNNSMGGFLSNKSRFVVQKHNITFNDVAGCDEAKEEVSGILDFLRRPQAYLDKGAKIPRGILLTGLPGTGKTLMARALSGEAGVVMIECSASEFVEMFVGIGAARVRELFDKARKVAPCVIFIDELDAIGKARGRGYATSANDEREQTLNEILVQMDGFQGNEGIVVIGATNRADVLDNALVRPGRFDRKVFLSLPDVKGREAILKVHIRKRKVPLANDVDLAEAAKLTPFLSGADLENIVNEAAVQSVLANHQKVTAQDLKEAIERFLYGPQKKNRVVIENERQIAAYHEAGHAVVGKYVGNADPLQKITIIPRGESAGATFFLPENERHIFPKKYLLAQLAVCMGGRVGEILKFNDESSGAFMDFSQATNIAQWMVCKLGMSDKIGKVSIHEHDDSQAKLIHEEVKKLLDAAYDKALGVVQQYHSEWEALAQALLEKETLNKKEIEEILKTPS